MAEAMAENEAQHPAQDVLTSLFAAGEQPYAGCWVSLRFLFSHLDSGVIIGRSGSNRREIQSVTGAQLQFSSPNEFWGATTDRIMHIQGELQSVVCALAIIINKLYNAPRSVPTGGPSTDLGGEPSTEAVVQQSVRDPVSMPPPDHATQLRLLIPASVCGVVIGPSGDVVRNISQSCNVSISLSPQDRRQGTLDYERVVVLTGPYLGLLQAILIVVSRVLEAMQDPNRRQGVLQQGLTPQFAQTPAYSTVATGLTQHMQVPALAMPSAQVMAVPMQHTAPARAVYHAAGRVGQQVMVTQHTPGPQLVQHSMPMGYRAMQVYSTPAPTHPAPPPMPLPIHRTEANFSIPDHSVGAIIGRGGVVLQQIKDLFNVRIVIADRVSQQADSQPRLVSIQGAPEQVILAQQFIEQRVRDAALRAASARYLVSMDK